MFNDMDVMVICLCLCLYRESMKKYWTNVFGEDKIFKSSELLAAEKAAVKAALAAQEREKAGLDLLEALQGKDDESD